MVTVNEKETITNNYSVDATSALLKKYKNANSWFWSGFRCCNRWNYIGICINVNDGTSKWKI